jgi:hypothetical protein
MRLQDLKLVKVGPSIGERIAARYHRNVVRRLCSLRQEWEKDLDGEIWTALEARAVLILSDVASALGLTESERAQVLGPKGVLALAGELGSRVYPALSDRQLTALACAEKHGGVTVRILRAACPGYSSETYRLDLRDLVECGLLYRDGHCKGTRYLLPD